ncbi:2-oxoglutarate oxidoreductase subunit KorA [subsurface metagenome]
MTASSGPGMDLFQEGIGNLHAHQLPVVIADIMRGGPGNGALHPAQQDYDQAIKGGRADQRNIVFAPWNAQEMYNHAKLAFDLADKYRNIVMILADNIIGQSYETVTIEDKIQKCSVKKDWILSGAKNRKRRLSIAHFPFIDVYNEFHRKLQEKYKTISAKEQRSEEYFIDEDCELIVVAYGIVARNALSAVKKLREKNYRVGLFRPVTLFPFPVDRLKEILSGNKKMLVVEMSAGQMATDIKSQMDIKILYLKPGQATAEVPKPIEIEKWIKESL